MLSKGTLEEVFSEWQLLQLILTVDLAGNSLHVPLSSTHPRRESALWPTGHTEVLARAGPTGRYASCTAICSSCSQRFYTEDLSPWSSFVLSQLETTDKALQECKFGAMLCCLPTAGSCVHFYYCVLWPLGHIAQGVVKIHHGQNKGITLNHIVWDFASLIASLLTQLLHTLR